MKILELTNYSAGICGVWTRVKEESKKLAELGHDVRVFSSDCVKGSDEKAKKSDKIGKVKVKRFKARKLGGESFMSWKFQAAAEKFNPDIIIAHGYRHLHTTRALKVAEKCESKIFLVTHAPFVEKGSTRTFISDKFVDFYDKFVGPFTLNQFDKIITITKWERPHLHKLGVGDDKIAYIPNGVPEEFFKQKEAKEENKVLFLGRISPIKNLEILIKAFKKIKDDSIKLEIVGPAETNYLKELKFIVSRLDLCDRVKFSPAINDLKKKIKKIDSAKIFVLPSKREAMPQSLIEAMSRGKIVISSDNKGSSELIKDEENGFLFKNGIEEDLVDKLNLAIKGERKRMREAARKSVEKFAWKRIISKVVSLFG